MWRKKGRGGGARACPLWEPLSPEEEKKEDGVGPQCALAYLIQEPCGGLTPDFTEGQTKAERKVNSGLGFRLRSVARVRVQ